MLALFLSALPAVFLASREEPETTMPLQLLQHQSVLQRTEEWRLKVWPMEWVHFPKAGSSFINAITHLPGNCPSLANYLNQDTVSGGTCWLSDWLENDCVRVCNGNRYSCPQGGCPHLPVTNYSAQRGHLVGMFRDPDQRILSGYHDDGNNFASFTKENFGILKQISKCKGDNLRGVPKRPLLEFAERWKGAMTYQLVPTDPATLVLDPTRHKMTRADGLEAAQRVREGFAFVGITEEWDLSICLFHKMFGGACHAEEFEDTRPGFTGKSADKDYDISQFQGWHDDIDEVVYAAALDVFRRNLIMFDVSQETCRECYSAATVTHGET
ncbi:unnamed protein product [Symbiodinium sp. CCMP2592]|nr:unnamed protein product [Symbiodinium sp. CCMP2592]